MTEAALETAFGLDLDAKETAYAFNVRKWVRRTEVIETPCNDIGNKAAALLSCGQQSPAKSPTTGALLHRAGGGPLTRTITCKDKACEDCQRRRAAMLTADLEHEIEKLRESRHWFWDGRLRMLTLTRWDPEHNDIAAEKRALWRAWSRLRKLFPQLETAVACMEETYNAERDSTHPHLHVIVLCIGRLDRSDILGEWQRINGYVIDYGQRKGSQGGCDIRERKSIKEAIKYPLKGMGRTLLNMPQGRAIELLDSLDGKRCVRTYGRLFRRSEEESDDGPDDVDDMLLVDETTGEVWASTPAAAKAAGVGVAAWTHHPSAIERVREWLYQERENRRGKPPRQEDIDRGKRATLRRRRRRRDTLLRSKLNRSIREALPETSTALLSSTATVIAEAIGGPAAQIVTELWGAR